MHRNRRFAGADLRRRSAEVLACLESSGAKRRQRTASPEQSRRERECRPAAEYYLSKSTQLMGDPAIAAANKAYIADVVTVAKSKQAELKSEVLALSEGAPGPAEDRGTGSCLVGEVAPVRLSHAGEGRAAVQRHPRAYPGDRGKGAAQIETSFAFEKNEKLSRSSSSSDEHSACRISAKRDSAS